MHPILASRRRLALYLLAWVPGLALLAYVTAATGGASWIKEGGVLAPAMFVYAFVCLSPWYLCRTRPLSLSTFPGTLATFAAAAVCGGLLLAGVGWATSSILHFATAAGHLPLWFGIGVLLYLLSTGLHYAALGAEASHEAERREAEARTLAREAQLQALRVQLNPHFLFNSLHSIAALATMDGLRAREMCIRLSDFLRTSLALGERQSIPLRDELALAQNYLEVEKVRFGDRLLVDMDIETGCETCAVPALLLQPLVENAVKHGIAGMVEPGAIRLQARREGHIISIRIENPFDPEASVPAKLGIGLDHVRRRLVVRYGDEAQVDAGPQNGFYRVVLRFPCEPSIASSNRA